MAESEKGAMAGAEPAVAGASPRAMPTGLGTAAARLVGELGHAAAATDLDPASAHPGGIEIRVGAAEFGMSAARLAERLSRARAGDLAPASADSGGTEIPAASPEVGTPAACHAEPLNRARPVDPVTAGVESDGSEIRRVGTVEFGLSAARLVEQLRRARAGDLDPPVPHADLDPAYAERPWGDRSATPLYCPITVRINEPLAEEVDRRVVAWAEDCGFDDEEVQRFRRNRFGRLAMLAHPDCEDPDRLLIAAKMNAAWWAADDYYADDGALGAVPELLPPRLVLAMAAMDPLPPAGEFSTGLEKALAVEPVLVSLRSGLEHMARYATPEQVQRTCYATFAMFVSWTAYAAWRHTGRYPPAWKYLAARQHDSFYTSMTLVDVLGGYTLPADLFYEPRVRRAAFQAGTAVVLLNDLYSVDKDMAEEQPPCNMVLQVAADQDCSIMEATEITVALHNDFVREFEASHRNLLAVASVELQRFLRGLRAWMGGAFEWHDSNPRYRTGERGPGAF